ncbi:hypothetical protein YQE_10474, partial [Dendroctonus ponderosae]
MEDSFDPYSITGILTVCKRELLGPYMRFLSLVGLRPIIGEHSQWGCCVKWLNAMYSMQVVIFLLLGYCLQYMSCFRRDRGFGSMTSTHLHSKLHLKAMYEKSCTGSLSSSFIFPSLLHFTGYLYASVVFRTNDDNQLPVLIERVFLTSSHLPNMQLHQRQIVKTLWTFVVGSFVWMLATIGLVSYMMVEGDVTMKWFEDGPFQVQLTLKILLVVCLIWHDIVQASVISNYCLQAQLLRSYVQFIREKLLQQSIRPLQWIRDIEEFRKLLTYLNQEVAPSVCIFTLINGTYAISGTLWLLAAHYELSNDIVPIYTGVNIANVVLWWFIAAAPFVQAARLTIACNNMKTVGQEVITRPFTHMNTPFQDLNSILIYTASLKIKAKLFNLPISGKYVGISFALLSVLFLVLSQSNILEIAFQS